MTERFIFNGEEKQVTGIDENGYGPLIGPLIITGIRLILPYDSIYSTTRYILNFHKSIKDSKKVFKRSRRSYIIGESIALSILKSAGYNIESFHSLLSSLSDATPLDLADFNLPTWQDQKHIDDFLLPQHIKVDKIHIEVFQAKRFNDFVERYNNKSFLDFYGFKLVRDKLNADVYMMGKIGGTNNYQKFFELTKEYPEVILEEKEVSYYKINDQKMYFLLNGDEMYLPLMLAGIIGKYVRELYMKAICERFGLFGDVPFASGYRHDRNTEILKGRIEKNHMSKYFIRTR